MQKRAAEGAWLLRVCYPYQETLSIYWNNTDNRDMLSCIAIPKQAVLGSSQAVPRSARVTNGEAVAGDRPAWLLPTWWVMSHCVEGAVSKCLPYVNSSVDDLARFQRAVSVMI